jgi:hypothetical protein
MVWQQRLIRLSAMANFLKFTISFDQTPKALP